MRRGHVSGLIWAVVAIWLIAAGSGAVRAADFDDVLGVWQGVQRCGGSELRTRLVISVQDSEPQLEARMDLFGPAAGDVPDASFEMQGFFMDYDGSVQLYPLRWLREAPGLSMFGFSGMLENGGRITGYADGGACAEMAFARAGDEDAAQAAASDPEAELAERLAGAFAGGVETADGVETLLMRVTHYDRATLQLEVEIVYPSLDVTASATGGAHLNTRGAMPLDRINLGHGGWPDAFGACLNMHYELIAAGVDRSQWRGTWRCLERGDGGSVLVETASEAEAEAIRRAARDWRAHADAEQARAEREAAAESARAQQDLAERIAAFEAEHQRRLEREAARREQAERRRQEDEALTAAEAERLARVEWLVGRNIDPEAQASSFAFHSGDLDFVARCNAMRSVVRDRSSDCLNDVYGSGVAAVVHVDSAPGTSVSAALCEGCRLQAEIDCGRRHSSPDDVRFDDTMGLEPDNGWRWARELSFTGAGAYCGARVRVPELAVPAAYVLNDSGISVAAAGNRAVGFVRPDDIALFGISPNMSAAEVYDVLVAQGMPRVRWDQYGILRRETGRCSRSSRRERDTSGVAQQVPLEMLALESQTVRGDFASGETVPAGAPLYGVADECTVELTGDTIRLARCALRKEDAATLDVVRHFTASLGPPATIIDSSGNSGGIWYCADYPDHDQCTFEAVTGPGGTYGRITVDTRGEERQLGERANAVAASDACSR